jgi:hypothetical protein
MREIEVYVELGHSSKSGGAITVFYPPGSGRLYGLIVLTAPRWQEAAEAVRSANATSDGQPRPQIRLLVSKTELETFREALTRRSAPRRP